MRYPRAGRISEKGSEIKMMKCVATCPELDYDNSSHCTCRSQSEIDDMYERYPDGCPVGNIPVWEEMRGDTDGAEST
jgi:hypothetical protein